MPDPQPTPKKEEEAVRNLFYFFNWDIIRTVLLMHGTTVKLIFHFFLITNQVESYKKGNFKGKAKCVHNQTRKQTNSAIHLLSHLPISSSSHSFLQLQGDVDTYGPVLAILMAIGGLDTRPRLGGLVNHEELGPGTVVKIEAKSKVMVLFHGRKAVKSCQIGAVKAVSLV